MISTSMSGRAIDKALKSIIEAQNTDNNGKILYISQGKLALGTQEELFDILELE